MSIRGSLVPGIPFALWTRSNETQSNILLYGFIIRFICYKQIFKSVALLQDPLRRPIVRSCKLANPRDLYLDLYDRSGILQTHLQQCCRCACQISKRYNNFTCQSRGFEILLHCCVHEIITILSHTESRMPHVNYLNVMSSGWSLATSW